MKNSFVGRIVVRGLLALPMSLALLGAAPHAQAASNCTVAASGAMYSTIQAAVNDTNCATIDVAAGTYTENVTVRRDVTINGASQDATIVDGNNAESVFLTDSTSVTLANLTIQHGKSEWGSGIRNLGTLTVKNSTISSNTATYGGGMYNYYRGTLTVQGSTVHSNTSTYGGGMYNEGALVVQDSTISNNSATYEGGGIRHSGGPLTVTNSTFSDNRAGQKGGGIVVYSLDTTSINNSTFSGNAASEGGGIRNVGGNITITNSTFSSNITPDSRYGGGSLNNSTGRMTLVNSILANSPDGNYCLWEVTSASHHNLIEGANHCGITNGMNGNIVGQQAQLGPLQDNGGPTQTHALFTGSPAIDAGSATDCPSTDQRGEARPQGAGCDIGAYEGQQAAPDTTAPTANPSQSPAANSAGWNNGDVAVSWNWSDNAGGSGLNTSTCSTTSTSSGEGTIALTATCKDLAGNQGSASYTVKVDKTAPTLSPVVSPNPVVLNGNTTISPNASDALSGVASQSCGAIDTSSVGAKTVACTAIDNAGNIRSVSVGYQVIYTWSGFLQPVDNLPTVNTAKAGSAVPVKLSLSGNQGLQIFATGSPASQKIACDSAAPLDEIEQTATAGASSLQYDAATNTYSYTWKTDKAWAGSCRQLTVTLVDGTAHTANFKFK